MRLLKNIFSYLIVLTIVFSSVTALPCSSFLMHVGDGDFTFSKNYDWKFGDGYILINPSHLSKKSLILDNSGVVRWKSKYSSITFNQYGAEFPNGGINQKGLMVEILWLDASTYEPKDERPILNELQWIQYQLDQHATTKEVIKNLDKIRIQNIYGKVHYIVCDKNAECATIEYINGKAVVHSDNSLPLKTITNSTYESSLNYIKNFIGFGGTKEIPMSGYGSLNRFVRINFLIKKFNPMINDPIEYSYNILNSVRKDDYTRWQIVYSPNHNSIYFRTDNVTQTTGLIETENLFQTCKQQRKFFDLKTDLRGQIKQFFKPLTMEENKKLVQTSLTKLMANPPDELVNGVATAPFSMKCEVD